jgi:hypothetical protein
MKKDDFENASFGVFRSIKNSNFIEINNSIFNNRKLSWSAIGIFVYLFSIPDLNTKDYKSLLINKEKNRMEIEKIKFNKKDLDNKIENDLKELEKYGYLIRKINEESGEEDWILNDCPD